PVPIRTFDAIGRLATGAGSLTESLGLDDTDLAVVETDGTIEQADSLKTAYDGAPATGFNVRDHSFDEALAHAGFEARIGAVDRVLVHPYVGPWMTAADDATASYLWGLALAASVLAGVPVEVKVPLSGDLLVLPTLGAVRLVDAAATHTTVAVRSDPAASTI